jgi:6-phosphogluconate dehydrogenase
MNDNAPAKVGSVAADVRLLEVNAWSIVFVGMLLSGGGAGAKTGMI